MLQKLPEPTVDPELLTIPDAQGMQQGHHVEFMSYLKLVMDPNSEDGETAVDDFTVVLFKILGYFRRPRLARTRVELPLLICGKNKHSTTDVCIVDRSQNHIFLIVQENKKLDENKCNNARAQLVAEAVGAFTENENARKMMGLAPMTEEVSHLLTS